MNKRSLITGYKAEIDNISEEKWSDTLSHFSDSNIYQTRSYGEIRWGNEQLSHLILKSNDTIVGA